MMVNSIPIFVACFMLFHVCLIFTFNRWLEREMVLCFVTTTVNRDVHAFHGFSDNIKITMYVADRTLDCWIGCLRKDLVDK